MSVRARASSLLSSVLSLDPPGHVIKRDHSPSLTAAMQPQINGLLRLHIVEATNLNKNLGRDDNSNILLHEAINIDFAA